uniref:Uncharacterized protein n=1 Tax=Lactuca sativa TaxID=4236 RepID=A0A9R1W7M1_LACSA|nr:hypothetical protein LSAT_V11C300129660 [Lactuca sativa]
MAASLFTYSSTSRRGIPAPNSPQFPIHIKATNVVFNPDIPEVHRGLGLDDFVNFLASCRLQYALSDVPSEFFPEQVCEFYYTATVNEENNAITGTIGHGRHSVFITAELLSAALRLDYGALFFGQLFQLLRANVHADHVPFPRWIALVFDKFFAADYFSHSGNPIQCPQMFVRMYQDDPLDTDIGISDRMREWIANPYTVPFLTVDTDEGGADAFSELMSLTRDISQRLLRIEADVQQIKEVLLLTPPSSPKSDDAQKGGDTDDDADADDHADGEPNAHADGEPNEKDTEPADNTIIQHESPNPIRESDSAGPNSPAATEKLFKDSEHDEEHDEPDDECQILDMYFIDPLIPVQQESSDDLEESHPILVDPVADPIISVQGEDSDVASEESHPLSRKRKAADTDMDHSQTDDSLSVKKPKSIVSISNLATEWNMSPDQVKQILDEANRAQLLKNIAQADESLIQHKLQAKGSFEAQMQKFLEFQSKAQSSQPPPCSSKPKTDSVLDRIDRKRFEDVFNRRMCGDKIIKVKASKPRNEKILTLLITGQGPQHSYSEVVKRDELIRYGYSEWMELLNLASKQTSAHSSELICALHLLIKKVQRLDLVPKERPQHQGQRSSVPRSQRTKFHVDGEDVLVLDFDAGVINNSLPFGVDSVQHQFISAPEHGMFYLDKNRRMCFQRTIEIPKAPTTHLVGLRQMCMSHQDLSGEFHILIAMELLNRRQELLDSPYWPVKIEAEAEYEEFLSRGVLI